MAKFYTTAAAVAQYLGTTLTTAQQTQATALLDPAERYIDLQTRRSWNPATVTITGEQYDLLRDWIYLKSTPVASIQSITVRTRQIGDAGTVLAAGSDYELQDASTGFVVFNAGYGEQQDSLADEFSDVWSAPEVPGMTPGAPQLISRSFALVSYTATQPVDATISHAATMLVAHWLIYQIDPARFGLTSKHQGQRTVQYEGRVIPAEVQDILALSRRGGVFG